MTLIGKPLKNSYLKYIRGVCCITLFKQRTLTGMYLQGFCVFLRGYFNNNDLASRSSVPVNLIHHKHFNGSDFEIVALPGISCIIVCLLKGPVCPAVGPQQYLRNAPWKDLAADCDWEREHFTDKTSTFLGSQKAHGFCLLVQATKLPSSGKTVHEFIWRTLWSQPHC